MTAQIPASAPFVDSFRDAAVAKLQSMYFGQIPDSVAAEVAFAALVTAWPAIEQHIREQIAREIEKSEFRRGPISGSNHYVGGYTDGLTDAARIARGEH